MSTENKKTILLVEDEAIVSMVTSKSLQKFGYNVVTANTGNEAVEIALNNKYINLILMDIDLGKGIDGTETATIILRDNDIPIVFLSSHTEPEIVEKTEKITSYGYVVKNSNLTVLDASIKMAFKLFDVNHKLNQSNEKLRHHTQLLENIIENFPGFVLWKDKNSIFLGCNSNFARKTGFSSPAEIIGKCDYDLPFKVEEVETFLVDDSKVMQTGIPKLHFEEREHISNGVEIFLDTCKIPIHDAEGNISGILAVAMEITERKQAEKLLKASEEKFSKFFQFSPIIAIISTIDDGKIVNVNNEFVKISGFSIEEAIGKTTIELGWVLPEDRKRLIEEFYLQKKVDGIEINLFTKDKKKLLCTYYAEDIYIDGKHFLLSLLLDITKRKISEEKYQLLFENMNSGFQLNEAILDENNIPIDFRYLDGNSQMKNYTGFSIEEVRGKTIKQLMPNADINMIKDYCNVALTGIPIKLEYFSLTFNKYFKINAYSPQKGLFAVIYDDITDRKQVEYSLKEREQKYRLLVENNHDIIYTLTSDGIFTFVSPAWTTLLGHTTSEVVGKSFQIFVNPQDIPSCLLWLQKVIETGERQDGIEYRVRHIDGSWYWHTSSAVPLSDENGSIVGFEGTARDITEKKIAENKIKSLLAEKELVLKEVNHRIKNSMNTLYGLLMLQSQTLEDSKAVTALESSANRVKSMMMLYDNLYRSDDFQKISLRGYLPSLIDEIISNGSIGKSVKIEKKIDDFVLNAKRLQPLGIIINELLTNIMKYAFIGRDDGVINVSVSLKETDVSLIIEDNGIGIPESVDFENSTGFGLQLVWMLTRELKGTIRIERGNGTKIILEFMI